MRTILWLADTVDWRKPETTKMVNRVLSKVENGTMILMHPTNPVAERLSLMITQIKEKRLKLGTVSDLMSKKRINNAKK